MTERFDERNMAKSRAVCEAIEAEGGGKRALTERERQILDMWPRFEDGERVWFGDGYTDSEGRGNVVQGVAYVGELVELIGSDGFHAVLESGERVERPAPKALDADGVEIRVGDTVWANGGKSGDGREWTVTGLNFSTGYSVKAHDRRGRVRDLNPKWLTHTPPDSWGRLEEDARRLDIDLDDTTDDYPRMSCARDIVRRAKALAGVA